MDANQISLEMKAKYPTKKALTKKIKIVEQRVLNKTTYIDALSDLLFQLSKEIKSTENPINRARCAVEYFETEEKLAAQKAVLSQHKMYLEELKKIEPDE